MHYWVRAGGRGVVFSPPFFRGGLCGLNSRKQKPLIRGAKRELGETGPGGGIFPGLRMIDGLPLYAGYSGLGGRFALPGPGRL
jgi:hypothetical protein